MKWINHARSLTCFLWNKWYFAAKCEHHISQTNRWIILKFEYDVLQDVLSFHKISEWSDTGKTSIRLLQNDCTNRQCHDQSWVLKMLKYLFLSTMIDYGIPMINHGPTRWPFHTTFEIILVIWAILDILMIFCINIRLLLSS